MKEKAKSYCRHRFARENVLVKLGRYTTRILCALVWVGVVWAFLTDSSLPRRYLEYLQGRNPRPCISSSFKVPAADRDLLGNYLNVNLSYIRNEYDVVAVSQGDTNNTYEVLLLRQNAFCPSVYEFQGYIVFLNNSRSDNDTVDDEGELSTDSVITATVDVLQVLHPRMNADLLSFPAGHFFSFILLLVVSSAFGVLAKWLFLPPLIGMIIAGFILRNVPKIDFARDISGSWSSTARNIALVLVLTRGGLAMDIKQLKRLKVAVLLLAFLPCLLEGAIDGMMGTLWLKLPWQFGFTLGYIIAAISPAVVVPTTLNLQGQGYGQESGIPTLIVAAASMDVVISISLFGVFLGLAFSAGNLILDIFRAPIQITIGLLYGVISGLLLWLFPTKHFTPAAKVRNRFFLMLGLGLFSLFGSSRAILGGSNLAGSGALGVLVLAFMAAQGWNSEEKKAVARVFYMVWQFFEPLLFGLIGSAVDIEFISPSLIGQGIGLILVGLVVRLTVSFIVVLGNRFRWSEMLFVAVAWLPKATVQAAIGSLALDIAVARNNGMEDGDEVELGRKILTVSVLAIILTAPLGAVATSLLGPILLKKLTDDDKHEEDEEEENKDYIPVTDRKTNMTQTSLGRSKLSNGHSKGVRQESIAMDSVIIEDLKAEPKTYNTMAQTSSS